MRLPGKDEERRASGITNDARQPFDVREDQRGTLVRREAAREADDQQLRVLRRQLARQAADLDAAAVVSLELH